MPVLEVIATCIEDVERICEGGADRIELVSALTEGGLTPSLALMAHAVKAAGSVQIMAMIRPHAMGFIYTKADIDLMVDDIKAARDAGVHGVVFGVTTPERVFDLPALERLIVASEGLEVTVHRAFDTLRDFSAGYAALCQLPGVTNLLTSGGQGTAFKNRDVLRELKGGRVRILAGSGVRAEQIENLLSVADDVHIGTFVRRNEEILSPVLVDKVRECAQALRKSQG